MTLTIEVTESDIARARAHGLDPAYLTHIAQEAAQEAIADALHDEDKGDNLAPLPLSLTAPLAETFRRSVADAEAGRVVDGETFLAEMRRLSGRE